MSTHDLIGEKVGFSGAARGGITENRPLRRFNILKWEPWLVPILMSLFIISLQVFDHYRMHQMHQSGQSLLQDGEFVWEVILFGIVFPLISGFMVIYLKRISAERDEAAAALEQRRTFARQAHQADSWADLVQFVVAFPGSFVSATRTFLMTQRSAEEPFRLEASWFNREEGSQDAASAIPVSLCQDCASDFYKQPVSTTTCLKNRSDVWPINRKRYCIRFVAGEDSKAVLAFDMPASQDLEKQQLQLLNDLGTEVAMAFDNANLMYVGEKQQIATKTERQRIARDLHDTLGQNIGYLHLKLDELSEENALTGITEIQREIAKMREVASDAYNQVRHTLADLRTEDQVGFHEALCNYVNEISSRVPFLIEIHSLGTPVHLDSHIQRQVVYIVREAVNNVEKHARAHRVDLNISWLEKELMVKIIDDGVGFAPETVSTGNHYGLLIMDERARSLGGILTAFSEPGKGAEIVVSLPLNNLNRE